MRKLFDLESPVFVFLGKAADLLLANLLWVLCSLPIVTIGASTAALYYLCFKLLSGEEPPVVRTFFREFKSNLKQATAIWLILLLVLLFLGFNIALALRASLYTSFGGMAVLCTLAVVTLMTLSTLTYALALQSYFQNPLRNTLHNGVYFALSQLWKTIVMLVCDGSLVVFFSMFCPFVLPVAPVLLNAFLLRKLFLRYQPASNP